mgnify:FL=1
MYRKIKAYFCEILKYDDFPYKLPHFKTKSLFSGGGKWQTKCMKSDSVDIYLEPGIETASSF